MQTQTGSIQPMTFQKPLTLVATLSLFTVLAGNSCTDVSISTDVDDEQKISDTAGNFEGDLDDGDRFGSAVTSLGDLEGDGVIDLAVGAPGDDDNGTDRGAVWILFMDDDGRVDLQRKISEDNLRFPGDLDNNDAFGAAVSGIGDLNGDGVFDLAVGAPGDDDRGTDRGAVWILFLDTNGAVQEVQKISAAAGGFPGDLNDGDQFGGAVATLGDLDGDGITDIAVGAQGDNDGGTGKGAVWVLFLNSDGSVKSTQKISEERGGFDDNLDGDDRFGSALAELGDLDGDGTGDLAVGASGDDDGGPDRGAVWILFLDADGRVSAQQKISQNKGEFDGSLDDGGGFGSALGNIGDLDGDGINDLVAGAPGSDDGGTDRGALWVLFMDGSGELRSDFKISATAGNFDGPLGDGDQFGSAVAGLGDLNGDTLLDIVSGAPFDNDGGSDRGALWILFMERTETELEEKLFL